MTVTSILFVRDRDFSWTAREVLREIQDRPHLLLRIDVEGPHFPERALVPFVRVVSGRRVVTALMTEIDDSQTQLRAYFATDVAFKGRLEFGYGSEVLGSFVLREPNVVRLDEARIDAAFHRVTVAAPGAFGAQFR